jgi:hypothetical protein
MGAIETAIEGGFLEGVQFAAEVLEENGQRELAIGIRGRIQRADLTSCLKRFRA